MNSKAISIKGLTKTYADGTQALKGIDLEVSDGDFFALLGANGAGKTTIIGILTDLVNKTAGDVQVYGYDIVKQTDQAKMMMGVVPQEMNFSVFEKPYDIVLNQAGYFGREVHEVKDYADELFKQLELWDKRFVQAKMLSGGMKRRLMIARALINKPKLLILDEPTAGVDVELRYSMWEFLKKLNQQQGVTILLTTHYLEEVEQLCRRAAIIKNGAIIKNDTVFNLLNLIEKETFVVSVDSVDALKDLQGYDLNVIDDHTLEVDVAKKGDGLNKFIAHLSSCHIHVRDLRPKGNRLEKIFLNVLKD